MVEGNAEAGWEGKKVWDDLLPLANYLESDDGARFPASASEADGFLAAVAAGPEAIAEAEWIEALFDGEPTFTSEEQAAAVLDGLRKRLASIIEQLASEELSYRPILLADEDWIDSSEWADGFMTAYALRPDAWQPLLKHATRGMLLIPIFSICYSEDGEPLLPLSVEEQDKAMEDAPSLLPVCVQAIHDFFINRRTRRALQSAIKPPKAGRNDPCPCGSGKKYKKCCLQSPRPEALPGAP